MYAQAGFQVILSSKVQGLNLTINFNATEFNRVFWAPLMADIEAGVLDASAALTSAGSTLLQEKEKAAMRLQAARAKVRLMITRYIPCYTIRGTIAIMCNVCPADVRRKRVWLQQCACIITVTA
jgi:hypothetical protein